MKLKNGMKKHFEILRFIMCEAEPFGYHRKAFESITWWFEKIEEDIESGNTLESVARSEYNRCVGDIYGEFVFLHSMPYDVIEMAQHWEYGDKLIEWWNKESAKEYEEFVKNNPRFAGAIG